MQLLLVLLVLKSKDRSGLGQKQLRDVEVHVSPGRTGELTRTASGGSAELVLDCTVPAGAPANSYVGEVPAGPGHKSLEPGREIVGGDPLFQVV